MNANPLIPLWVFNILYLTIGGVYFLQDLNFEFIIYVLVLLLILGGVLLAAKYAKFPRWQLWLLSFWGLLHVLGGAVQTADGVLFAYRLYPFIDLGGEFYILKYDQLVHFYLYGVVALMSLHILRNTLAIRGHNFLVFLCAVLVSVGISALNEIMEFIIAMTMENGVGGYENTMLDIVFNLLGAVVFLSGYRLIGWKKEN